MVCLCVHVDVWEITENDTRLEPVHKRAGTPRGDTGGVGDKTEVCVSCAVSTVSRAAILPFCAKVPSRPK